MNPQALYGEILKKQSFLCVGLDTDPAKLPEHLLAFEDPVYEFNKAIIEATADLAVAFKPNLAFYEAQGIRGWESLRKTLDLIPEGVMKLADAKRGDIGNTAHLYARAFFEEFDFDAVTVAPYMGHDSVTPFLQYPDKWVFLLALTSNPGAEDFQWHTDGGQPLYKKVLSRSLEWAEGQPGHLGFVAGATRPEYLKEVREIAPDNFLLVPGVGAQGGTVKEVADNGLNDQCGLLVNSSRGILYASSGKDFAEAARASALELQGQMALELPQPQHD